MKKLLLALGLLLLMYGIPNHCLAQQSKIDSLENALKKVKTDEDRMEIYQHLAMSYSIVDSKKQFEYAEKSLVIAKEINVPSSVSKSYDMLGAYYYGQGEYEEALNYYNKSLILRKKNKLSSEAVYNNIALVYQAQGKISDAIKIMNDALKYHFQYNTDSLEVIKLYANMGYLYMANDEYLSSVEHSKIALGLAIQYRDSIILAITYHNLGMFYHEIHDFPTALDYYLKSVAIKDKTNDRLNLAGTYSNIASLYSEERNFEKALEYYQKTLEIDKEFDYKIGLADDYLKIGIIYGKQLKYNLAIDYYNKSLSLNQEIGAKRGEVECYFNIAVNYWRQKKYKLALDYVDKSKKISEEKGFKINLSACYILYGRIYTNQGVIPKANINYINAKEIIDKIGNVEKLLDLKELRFKIDSTSGNYSEALRSFKDYIALKDSIFNETKSEQIANMQIKYETEKKEQENALLKSENELKESELNRQYILNISIGIGAGLSLLAFFLAFRSFRIKQRDNKTINAQNVQLEDKNQEISRQNQNIRKYYRDLNHRTDNLLKLLETSLVYSHPTKTSQELEQENRLRMSTVIAYNELLNLRELESKDRQINPRELFPQITASAQEIFKVPNWEVKTDIEVESLNTAQAQGMASILSEAVINAVKYAYEGIEYPKFEVSLQEKENKQLELTIADNGIGLPENSEEKTSQGLKLMKEFAQSFRAEFNISTENGTKYKVTTPYVSPAIS